MKFEILGLVTAICRAVIDRLLFRIQFAKSNSSVNTSAVVNPAEVFDFCHSSREQFQHLSKNKKFTLLLIKKVMPPVMIVIYMYAGQHFPSSSCYSLYYIICAIYTYLLLCRYELRFTVFVFCEVMVFVLFFHFFVNQIFSGEKCWQIRTLALFLVRRFHSQLYLSMFV